MDSRMKKTTEPPPKREGYVYNKRLQQTLNALDSVRTDLGKAVSRLKASNDELEQKLKLK